MTTHCLLLSLLLQWYSDAALCKMGNRIYLYPDLNKCFIVLLFVVDYFFSFILISYRIGSIDCGRECAFVYKHKHNCCCCCCCCITTSITIINKLSNQWKQNKYCIERACVYTQMEFYEWHFFRLPLTWIIFLTLLHCAPMFVYGRIRMLLRNFLCTVDDVSQSVCYRFFID